MGLDVDVEIPAVDFIDSGESFKLSEGQHIIRGPMTILGELIVEGHLIIE